jgi:hypothetical protein
MKMMTHVSDKVKTDPAVSLKRQGSKLNALDPLSKALKQLNPDSRKPFREIIERIKYAKREYEDIRKASEEAVRASIQIYHGHKQDGKFSTLAMDR